MNRRTAPQLLAALVILLALLANVRARAEEAAQDRFLRGSLQLLRHLEQRQYAAAAAMLMATGENDRARIETMFDIIIRELGYPSEAESVEEPVLVAEIGVGGGAPEDWTEVAPHDHHVVYLRTAFTYAGEGYVVVRFLRSEGTWGMRSVDFGLPKSEGSRQRMVDIADRLALELSPP